MAGLLRVEGTIDLNQFWTAGESDADRWQLEQRIRHAENQLAVVNGTGDPHLRPRTAA